MTSTAGKTASRQFKTLLMWEQLEFICERTRYERPTKKCLLRRLSLSPGPVLLTRTKPPRLPVDTAMVGAI